MTADSSSTYAADLTLLRAQTDIVELKASADARVAVAPAFQGRVMTSALAGDDGASFGWLNSDFISSGTTDDLFNNYGGEDRFWLGPEAGQFGLWFDNGEPFDLDHWKTPAGFNSGAFEVTAKSDTSVTMTRRFEVTNYSGASFACDVQRTINVIDSAAAAKLLGANVDGLQMVGFESVNELSNAGDAAWTRQTGLVSVWILGQYKPLPAGKVIVPFVVGDEADLGPAATTDYFCDLPAERGQFVDGALLFACDGRFRSKIGVSPARAKRAMGSYDPDAGVLTIVTFNLPADAPSLPYVNSLWELQDAPFAGDAVNSYNDGEATPGAGQLGPFYEIETSSPAAELAPGEAITHVHQTMHFAGDPDKLNALAQVALGVNVADLSESAGRGKAGAFVMAESDGHLSTGLVGLDKVLDGLRPGDNVVWQITNIDRYLPFVRPFARQAAAEGRQVVYFRFASHEPLLEEADGIEVIDLQAAVGFETFVFEIHSVIKRMPPGSCFIFDCLSTLAVEWCSDQMLGNFFQLTCPYLLSRGIATYFVVYKNIHSFHAMTPLAETAQILLEVYRHDKQLYLHPTKVADRYTRTINMLHRWKSDDEFVPVTNSVTNARILTAVPWQRLESAAARLGVWNRAFANAEEVHAACERGECPADRADELSHELMRMALSRERRVLGLLEKYLTLGDVVGLRKRMFGTGLIGGKSVGMLLARAILRTDAPDLYEKLEPHDSFFIGSDVFYTFLVRNDLWWARAAQRDDQTYLAGNEEVQERMLTGTFPPYLIRQFNDLLDYFGQAPFIVRSSSLLEDSFGNAFAGQYESVFCANQGPRHERLTAFLDAVRRIYASSMSERALSYRARRGLLTRDERMGLLVQRVSGASHGGRFYPMAAGVGLSFNPYVWSDAIDPAAGVLRLVFGLGTRAVEQHDDDYTRIVALNAPTRRPEMKFEFARQYSQRRVDVLNLPANRFETTTFADVVPTAEEVPFDLFAQRDRAAEQRAAERGITDANTWTLTFDQLLSETKFVEDMRRILRTLQEAYQYPIDIEFTANYFDDRGYINVVQCRPFQIVGGGTVTHRPDDLRPQDIVLESRGPVIGHSRNDNIDRIIYVVPAAYGQLPIGDRYAIARLIGEIAHLGVGAAEHVSMLIGPGRWGTTMPTLGVPINFGDINTVSILCEIVTMRDDLVPDVSLGTHLFNEMVEMDMLYLALFPDREYHRLNESFFESAPNKLAQLLPHAKKWETIVHVIDPADMNLPAPLRLYANTINQEVCCYHQRA